jgi:hypothetical protein
MSEGSTQTLPNSVKPSRSTLAQIAAFAGTPIPGTQY